MKMNWATWSDWQLKEIKLGFCFYYNSILDCWAMMANTRSEMKFLFSFLHEICFSSWYLVECITRNIIYFTSFNIKLSHFLTPQGNGKESRNLFAAGAWTVLGGISWWCWWQSFFMFHLNCQLWEDLKLSMKTSLNWKIIEIFIHHWTKTNVINKLNEPLRIIKPKKHWNIQSSVKSEPTSITTSSYACLLSSSQPNRFTSLSYSSLLLLSN